MNRQQIRKLLLLASFLLFPVIMFYFSPVLVIEGAVQGMIVGSFLVFGILLLGAMFFGRSFCGWLCPAGGLQELCMTINDKPTVGGKYDRIKFFIWVPWLTAIVAAFFLAGGVHSVEPLWGTTAGISITKPIHYIIFYGFITLIALLAIVGGRRGFCHYVCWMSPFMMIGDKMGKRLQSRRISLQADTSTCMQCKICSRNCVMSLPVHEMVAKSELDNTECILCGQCVDSCPKKAITYC